MDWYFSTLMEHSKHLFITNLIHLITHTYTHIHTSVFFLYLRTLSNSRAYTHGGTHGEQLWVQYVAHGCIDMQTGVLCDLGIDVIPSKCKASISDSILLTFKAF